MLVLVTFPEAVAIAEHLLSTPIGTARVQNLTLKIFEQLAPLSDPELSRESYFKQKRPCIFLSEGKCDVYSARPSACRYHYVVSDPKNCAHDAEDPITSKLDLRKLEKEVVEDGRRVSKQVGIPFTAAPLPVALSWALRYIKEGRQLFDLDVGDDLEVMKLSYWTNRAVLNTGDEDGTSPDARTER